MPRLIMGSAVIAAAEIAAGLVFGEPALVGSSLLTAGFAVMLIAGGGLVDTRHERHLGTFLAAGVYLLGLLGAVLIPDAALTSALLPILSVVLLLPGRSRRAVGAILAVALFGSLMALLAGDLPHPFPPLREPLGSAFTSATMLGITMLILGALYDFASQSRDALDRVRAVHARPGFGLRGTHRHRRRHGSLERHETLEATATLIVDDLCAFRCGRRRRPDLSWRGHRDAGRPGPADLPVYDRHDHAAGTRPPPPGQEPRRALGRALGARCRVRRLRPRAEREWPGRAGYAPFYDGGRIIGIVAIGTCSEASADHLVADLPAVAEFAATSSLLLAPMLAERHEGGRPADHRGAHRDGAPTDPSSSRSSSSDGGGSSASRR